MFVSTPHTTDTTSLYKYQYVFDRDSRLVILSYSSDAHYGTNKSSTQKLLKLVLSQQYR